MSERFDPVRLSSPDWLLAGFDLHSDHYQLAHVSRQTYFASAFLDHRIQPLPTAMISLVGHQVDEVLAHSHPAHVAWIIHTGFCCSTLLATCLDHPGSTLVLREPLVLSRLAHAKRHGASGDTAVLELAAQRVIGLCERSYPGETLLVKPSNFANNLVAGCGPAGAQQLQRKAILMSSSLQSLLVSILKKQAEAESALPGFLHALLQDSDYLQAAGLENIDHLDLLQQSVLFWHCQRYYLQRCLAQSAEDRFMPLSMERFLSEPIDVLNEVSGFLALGLSPETIQQTVLEGAFRRHSKNRHADYDATAHQQEQQEIMARFGSEIDSAMEWAKPLLAKLPVRAFDVYEEGLVQ